MENIQAKKKELNLLGYAIIDSVYTKEEIQVIGNFISTLDTSKAIFRKTADLFAIRQFIKEVPEIAELILNDNLKAIINGIGGKDYFVVKSIYFDKPEKSNWFVSYHQDLTISVDQKKQVQGFTNWTTKQNQFSVQPSLDILENIFTLRIHLDKTDEKNGALKVLEKSHLKAITRVESLDSPKEQEVFCNVNLGGVMLMKPLLFHGSNKTTNERNRRVIHIEFSNKQLPLGLSWAEKTSLPL